MGPPLKPLLFVDDFGKDTDMETVAKNSIVTLEPFIANGEETTKTSILHIEPVPLYWSFDIIFEAFLKFGCIKEIKNKLSDNYQFFES